MRVGPAGDPQPGSGPELAGVCLPRLERWRGPGSNWGHNDFQFRQAASSQFGLSGRCPAAAEIRTAGPGCGRPAEGCD
jgi:hypothetical protein